MDAANTPLLATDCRFASSYVASTDVVGSGESFLSLPNGAGDACVGDEAPVRGVPNGSFFDDAASDGLDLAKTFLTFFGRSAGFGVSGRSSI